MKVQVLSRRELHALSEKYQASNKQLPNANTFIAGQEGEDIYEIVREVQALFRPGGVTYNHIEDLVPTVLTCHPAMLGDDNSVGPAITVMTVKEPHSERIYHVSRFKGKKGFGDIVVIHHWTKRENEELIDTKTPIFAAV